TCLVSAGSEPAYPPGSRVGLEVPGDLKPSTRIPGFEATEQKVSIALLDLSASAYFELDPAAFTKLPDFQLAKREGFPFESGIGFLITGITKTDGVRILRMTHIG